MTSGWKWFGVLLVAAAWAAGQTASAQAPRAQASGSDEANRGAAAKKTDSDVGAGVNQSAAYRVAGGVAPPKAIYAPGPEYTKAARKAGIQGVVVLLMVVSAEGKPRDITVARSLSPDLDQKAIDAVSKWRFKPATKEGHPVGAKINVEVRFRLW